MELIPILSTIILVATISTFILAVGAYILYKVRERRTRELSETKYRHIETEYIEPESVFSEIDNYPEKYLLKNEESSSFRKKYKTKEEHFGSKPKIPGGKYPEIKEVKKTATNGSAKVIVPETKFMKYTIDGYIDADKEENAGEIKWR